MKLGKDLLQFFGCFDELDFDGQVFRQTQDSRGVHFVIGAESGDAPDHTGARNAPVKQIIQDGGIEGLAVVLLVLAHVNADFFCRPLFQHFLSPIPVGSARHFRGFIRASSR